MVKRSRGKVLKDVTDEFNVGNVKIMLAGGLCNGHKNQIYRRVVRKRIIVKGVNRKKRLPWCLQKWRSTVNQYWRTIIFSDESRVVLGQINRVYVWQSAHEECRLFSECKS